jgi:hypothetical protein
MSNAFARRPLELDVCRGDKNSLANLYAREYNANKIKQEVLEK